MKHFLLIYPWYYPLPVRRGKKKIPKRTASLQHISLPSCERTGLLDHTYTTFILLAPIHPRRLHVASFAIDIFDHVPPT